MKIFSYNAHLKLWELGHCLREERDLLVLHRTLCWEDTRVEWHPSSQWYLWVCEQWELSPRVEGKRLEALLALEGHWGRAAWISVGE